MEEQRFHNESTERLRNSIRETLNGFTVKNPFGIGLNAKKQWVNENKFVELMMELGTQEACEAEAENYRYFCMRFWMRMRKDKSITRDGEVPVDDLIDFLMRSKSLLPKVKPDEFAQAILAYTHGKQTISLQEFQTFATGHIFDFKVKK